MVRRVLALAGYLQVLFAAHTLAPIAAIIFFEELGIPLVLPGDLAMMFAGERVAQGRASLWSVLLVEELATLAGAGLLFMASRRVGRPLVLRFGRYVGLNAERMIEAETRIHAHEMRTVVVGRLIPGLRMITVMAAGVADVRPAKFFPALAFGGFIYLCGYTVLGAVAGPPIIDVYTRLAIPVGAMLSLLGLIVVLLVVRMLRRSVAARQAMQGTIGIAVVGGLAAFAGLLSANLLLGLLAVGGQLAARNIALDTAQASDQLRFLIGWPLFFALALAVSGLSAVLRLRERPAIVRLAATVAVPLATTLLLIDPLGDRATETPMAVTTVIGATAVIRWLVFGLVSEMLPGFPRRAAQAQVTE